MGSIVSWSAWFARIWPLPRSHVSVPIVIVILTACFTFRPGWPPATWELLAVRARDYTIVPAAVSLVWGMTAGRALGARGVLAPPSTPGPVWPVGVRLSLASGAAVAIGLLPSVIWTALHAPESPGRVESLLLMSSLAVHLFWPALGLVIGVLLPSRWVLLSTPLVMIVLVAGPLLVNNVHPVLSVAPFWGNSFPWPGWRLHAGIAGIRALWWVALTFALLTGADLWHRRITGDTTQSARRRWVSAAVAAAPAGLVGSAMLLAQPNLVVVDDGEGRSCRSEMGATFCVLQSEMPVLDAAQDRLSKAASFFTPRDGAPSTLVSHGHELAATGDPGAPYDLDLRVLGTRTDTVANVVDTASLSMAGVGSCSAKVPPGQPMSPETQDKQSSSVELGRSVAARALGRQDSTKFQRMDDESLTDWVSEHLDQLTQCAMPSEDLPS